MALIQSNLVLESWLIGQNDLKNSIYPNLVSEIPVAIKKKISCIAHACTKRVKNMKFIWKCVFIYHLLVKKKFDLFQHISAEEFSVP
jgi:hypothetical protein